jgi:hypothetical protein
MSKQTHARSINASTRKIKNIENIVTSVHNALRAHPDKEPQAAKLLHRLHTTYGIALARHAMVLQGARKIGKQWAVTAVWSMERSALRIGQKLRNLGI